jgi:hypothetical protein
LVEVTSSEDVNSTSEKMYMIRAQKLATDGMFTWAVERKPMLRSRRAWAQAEKYKVWPYWEQ